MAGAYVAMVECVCVFVCVCVRERESVCVCVRERECVYVSVCVTRLRNQETAPARHLANSNHGNV